ncbi:MAG: elongation factor Ts [Candidatus Dormibacteraeota bacterium]|nr:elongation factor Ts [Candidatus Dormibacteraeota bacterium]MBO0759783.1 elongation factor Ts [Candidatus Dormibacteraeota bacterium]
MVKELRDLTGAGMMDCKQALEESGGDLEKATVLLREKGIAKAAKRAGRETAAGLVEAYLHRTSDDFPPQVGALVEVDCESDFVAKGDDVRHLARELAMHVAASAPRWVAPEDVPEGVLDEERELHRRKAEQDGRPAQAIDRIVEGQIKKFYEDNVLLEQPWVRDPKMPIKDLVTQTVAKVQENITVRRFSRFSIKEG